MGRSRNADVLAAVLEGPGSSSSATSRCPGARAWSPGSRAATPRAPSLLLMGHTDVVPANAESWRHDPFGGELIDGDGLGSRRRRHAQPHRVDGRRDQGLADAGFRPQGSLTYLAVADEEAAARYGAEWLLEHQPDAVAADYVITETGGMSLPIPARPRPLLPVMVGEKGFGWVTPAWCAARPATARCRCGPTTRWSRRQRSCIGSLPIQSSPPIEGPWRAFIEACAPRRITERLFLDPDALTAYCASDDATRAGPADPRHDDHDDRADDGAGRREDQRDRRPGRARARHPHPAGRRRPTTSCAPSRPRSATG